MHEAGSSRISPKRTSWRAEPTAPFGLARSFVRGYSMSKSRLFAAGALAVLCLAATAQAAEQPRSDDSLLSSLARDLTPPVIKQLGEREGVQMLLTILRGEMPDAGTG